MAEVKSKRVSLKDMTLDELKEHKRKQNREYMAKRMKEDPEFAKKQKELQKKWRQTPEVKEKERIRNQTRVRDRSQYFSERYKIQKEKYQLLLKEIEEMEKKVGENKN